MQFLEKILEYIFLPTCGVCGKLGEGYLCGKCEKELKKYEVIEESINNNILNKERIDKMYIFKYTELVRNLILQYKFNDKAYLYRTFCEFIVKNKKVFDFIKSYDIIIPVPIHKARMRERGYNQSEIIAETISKILNIELIDDIIVRKKETKALSSLNSKTERINMIKNAFAVNINYTSLNKINLLIIDDVFTTGSTLNELSKEIKKLECINRLGVLTVARA